MKELVDDFEEDISAEREASATDEGDVAGGIGASEVMERRASAATMPPME